MILWFYTLSKTSCCASNKTDTTITSTMILTVSCSKVQPLSCTQGSLFRAHHISALLHEDLSLNNSEESPPLQSPLKPESSWPYSKWTIRDRTLMCWSCTKRWATRRKLTGCCRVNCLGFSQDEYNQSTYMLLKWPGHRNKVPANPRHHSILSTTLFPYKLDYYFPHPPSFIIPTEINSAHPCDSHFVDH